MTNEQLGAALVAAVQARGSDADDPRDAAHEACHALEWGLSKKWTRENVDRAKPKGARKRAEGVSDEITARAVEMLVCQRLDVEYDVKKWAFTCIMETLKLDGIALPSIDWLVDAIKSRAKTKHAIEIADRVLALASAP